MPMNTKNELIAEVIKKHLTDKYTDIHVEVYSWTDKMYDIDIVSDAFIQLKYEDMLTKQEELFDLLKEDLPRIKDMNGTILFLSHDIFEELMLNRQG